LKDKGYDGENDNAEICKFFYKNNFFFFYPIIKEPSTTKGDS
jgi:hypothetical protein